MKYRLPTLPFGHADLEPFLSREAIDTHYFGHHKGYVDKTNELMGELGLDGISLEKVICNHEGKLFNNAAQAWNHTFYWFGLAPEPGEPSEELVRAIENSFGGLEEMKDKFLEVGKGIFGSGYAWLVADDKDHLEWKALPNGDCPLRLEHLRPVWTCDVWEHAYYIDYRNVRAEYLEGAWKHVNWEFVSECFKHKRPANMSRFMTDEQGADEIRAPV